MSVEPLDQEARPEGPAGEFRGYKEARRHRVTLFLELDFPGRMAILAFLRAQRVEERLLHLLVDAPSVRAKVDSTRDLEGTSRR